MWDGINGMGEKCMSRGELYITSHYNCKQSEKLKLSYYIIHTLFYKKLLYKNIHIDSWITERTYITSRQKS